MALEPRTMRGAAFSVFSEPSAEELEASSEPEPEPESESELELESESEEPVSEEAPVPVLVAVLRVEEAPESEPEAVEDYNR